ncbi:MAG: ribbon-helix-helix domain-containing protein [Candidatus Bathyarchaeia archaeon]
MKNLRITVRVEEPDRQKIERLMHDGKFKNMSQVLRRALQEFLKTQ